MSNGGNSSDDGLLLVGFILLITVGVAFCVWYLFKPQLLQGYLWIRQGEIAIGSLWTDDDKEFQVVINNTPSTLTFGQARSMLDTLTPEAMLTNNVNTFDLISATTQATLRPLRIPVGIIFLCMVYYAMFRGPTSYHRKAYTLDALIKIQSTIFNVIHPIVGFNPAKATHRAPGDPVPAELPLFAEALSPEEWLAFHKIPINENKADREYMDNSFSIQLMDQWKGVQKAPAYVQILLASFALKTVRKRLESDDILGRLALCWDHKGGLKLSRDPGLLKLARKTLKDKSIASQTLKQCNRHAFTTTALLGALELARSEGGVLAPSQFLWLRGHNRTLWYPLNNLGRQAFHTEAMGAMSHYRAEKQIKRPIPRPIMRDAIKAMEEYVEEIRKNETPIPQVDYSMVKNKKDSNKNKGILKPAGT
jgi:intracellular multiplication protein IcmP